MVEKKYCLPKQAFCMSEKTLIAIVFAAIILIAFAVSYVVTTEKTTQGYTAGPLKLFLISIDKFTIALTIILGVAILAISVKAFQKIQTAKFLFIMLAFALFVFEWLLKLIDRYYIPGQLLFDPVENLIEMAIITFLALGIFRK